LQEAAVDPSVSDAELSIIHADCLGSVELPGEKRTYEDLSSWRVLAATDVPWLFTGAIPRGYVTVISARGATGKTTLAAGLELSILLGAPVVPGFEPTCAGGVIALYSEDSAALHLRKIQAFAHSVAVDGATMDRAIVEGLKLCCLDAEPLLQFNEGVLVRTAAYEALERDALRIRPCLTVLDTLWKLAGVQKENDVAQTGVFLDACAQLAKRSGAAVLVVAHSNKGGARGLGSTHGSSAIEDEARAVWTLPRQTTRFWNCATSNNPMGRAIRLSGSNSKTARSRRLRNEIRLRF
jgi:RecA-family ATPase